MVMRLKDVGGYQPMLETNQGDNCLEQVELTPRVRLMGDFLYKGDFAVLCGAEGSGKSILAFQLADALSKGKPVEGFANECERQRVLFLDFENKHERFIRRYSQEGQNKYKLSSGFFRTTFSSKFTEYVGLRKEFHVEMNRRIPGREPEVLIVNNLDVAKCFVSEAFLIALLREYQARLNLTVVLVTSINPGKTPVYLNRLGKNLRGMADSVIAIGQSKKGKNIRYLKQLKSSTGETTYDENELPEFTIEQRDNFTGFYHNGFSWEDEHLSGPPEGLDLDIINLKNQQPNLTYKEIADKLETNKTRVMRALDRGLRGLGDCTEATFERGLSRLGDFADEVGHGSAILCPAEAEGRLEARQRIVGREEEESSPCPLLSPAIHPQGGMPNAEPEHLLTKITDMAAPLPSGPFRGSVELSEYPSDSGVKSERGLNRLRDFADAGKSEQTVGALVTSTLKNAGLPSPPIVDMVEPLNVAPLHVERGSVGQVDHSSDSGVRENVAQSERGLNGLRDFADAGKSEQSVGALVTSTLKNDTATDAPSFSNPRLQTGGEEHHTDSLHQGNDTPHHTKTPAPLPTDPFRGNVELSEYPSDPGVTEETLEESLKTLDALITSYCKPQPKAPNNEPGPQKKPLTYSQELKKRLAQARMTKKK